MTSLSKHTDEELMQLSQAGNQNAFSTLYDRYCHQLLRFFYGMLNGDNEKAEDLMHDLFLKVIKKKDLFDSKQSFSSWIYSVAHNMVKNEYRKMHVRKNMLGENHIPTNTHKDPTISPDKKTDLSNFQTELSEALLELDEDKRDLFLLRHYQQFSVKELAEVFELAEGTVKSRLHYINKFLSERLKHYSI
ncbi:MAG: hypothetical protein CL843_11450 [Crocinitomicaceae bacterium]|nr:hypothetical protein [Crocinitomicaceae bacterium]